MTTTIEPAAGAWLAYQCTLPLPLTLQTLSFVDGLLRAHLKKTGSPAAQAAAFEIALIVLAALRHDYRLADMADGNGVLASIISRWTWEIIQLLAARPPAWTAPGHDQEQGGEAVLLDAP